MFRNYLTIAWRSLMRQKFYAFINVIGLSVGIASFLMIMMFVKYEFSYDKYHTKADRIYRIDFHGKIGDDVFNVALAGAPTGPTLRRDYPEVEEMARIRERGDWLVKTSEEAQNIKEERIVFADSSLFKVFSFEFVEQSTQSPLNEPNTMVINQTLAQKYFPNESAVGKTLILGNNRTYKIVGVFTDMPDNSHFQFDGFLTMLNRSESTQDVWMSFNFNTYLLLGKGASPKALEAKFPAMVRTYIGADIERFMQVGIDEFFEGGNQAAFRLTPLADIHLYSDLLGELGNNGDAKYVLIFSLIGLFILIIACINFMNLATARASKRAKEVGLRKVMGAWRPLLVRQFLTESVLVSFIALAVGTGIILLALPWFNELANKSIPLAYLFETDTLATMLGTALLVGLLAGSYPAFYLSAFQPAEVLKGTVTRGRKSGLLRSFLVVIQFVTTIFLIAGTLVIYNQLSFMQNKKLGFNQEQVLVLEDTWVIDDRLEAFRNDLLAHSAISNVSVSGYLPIASSRNNNAYWPGKTLNQEGTIVVNQWVIDHDYLETMGINLAMGRNFDRAISTDTAAVLINERAITAFGLGPEPLGKYIGTFGDVDGSTEHFKVIGVVKDFHFSSLRDNIQPLVMELGNADWLTSVRFTTDEVKPVLSFLESKWDEYAPGQPFAYEFMDEQFNNYYSAERRTSKLAVTFTVLAIFVACLGLFGLAAYTTEQRTKEIGIRKVLGASVWQVVFMLYKQFGLLILVAMVFAIPAAWYFMNEWLSGFQYRIDLNVLLFIGAGIITLAIAWLTMSFQSFRAATLNPSEALRDE